MPVLRRSTTEMTGGKSLAELDDYVLALIRACEPGLSFANIKESVATWCRRPSSTVDRATRRSLQRLRREGFIRSTTLTSTDHPRMRGWVPCGTYKAAE